MVKTQLFPNTRMDYPKEKTRQNFVILIIISVVIISGLLFVIRSHEKNDHYAIVQIHNFSEEDSVNNNKDWKDCFIHHSSIPCPYGWYAVDRGIANVPGEELGYSPVDEQVLIVFSGAAIENSGETSSVEILDREIKSLSANKDFCREMEQGESLVLTCDGISGGVFLHTYYRLSSIVEADGMPGVGVTIVSVIAGNKKIFDKNKLVIQHILRATEFPGEEFTQIVTNE